MEGATAAEFMIVAVIPVRDAEGRVLDARVEFANERWRQRLVGGANPVGRTLRELFADDSLPVDLIVRVLERGEPEEAILPHPSDPDASAEVQLTPMGDRVLIVARELTRELALRKQLEQSRAELLAAQRLAGMGSWTWDPRTDRAQWSETLFEIHGLDATAPTPSFAEQRQYYDEETLKRNAPSIERAVHSGEPYAIEYDITRADGTRRHVIAHGESIRIDGAFAGLRGTVVDITELHQAREQLRASEERFARVFAAVDESIAVIRAVRDDQGELVDAEFEWVNPAWYQLWRVDDDVVGRSPYDVNPAFLPRKPQHRQLLHGVSPLSLTFTQPDGRTIESTVVRLDADRIVAVGRDVTALRKAQEEHDRTRRAEQLVNLSAGVAHQFNNLLMVISGNVEHLADVGLESEREEVAAIRQATARAASLVRHLVAYAQRQVMRPSRFELGRFLEQRLPQIWQALGAGVDLHLKPSPQEAWVGLDSAQLEAALLELTANARKAMPAGGTLELSVELAPPSVLLHVRDTGRGIAPENLARVFEPFFSTGAFGESVGLGLSSVQGMVQQSGGAITVDSTQGKGTTFTLAFPQVEPAAATTPSPESQERARTVLVVDDDDDVRAVIARAMRRLGYTTLDTRTGARALELLRTVPVDLLLTDVEMPEMRGGELAEQARALQPTLKVLFMSGYAASALEAAGTLAAGAPFLAKPFSRAALRSALGRAGLEAPED